MTYHPNNPGNRPPGDPVHHPANIDPIADPGRRSYGATSWIVGALALLAIIGLVFWMSESTEVATITDRPVATDSQRGSSGPAQQPTVTERGQDSNTGQSPRTPQ